MEQGWFFLIMAIPLVTIIGGLINAALALHHRARIKELALRERIAMIERGITPPPEVDPAAFDRDWDERAPCSPGAPTAAKHRTAGVILTGVGLGVGLLIALTSGDMRVGVGVGGAITILGIAFLVNSVLSAQQDRRSSGPARPHPGVPDAGNMSGDSGAPNLP